jgi:hypothetical protein
MKLVTHGSASLTARPHSPLGLNASIAILCSLICLVCAHPAHAQWVPYQIPNSLSGPNGAVGTPDIYGGSESVDMPFGGGPGGANSSGTVTPEFKWTGQAGQSVTPLYVLLQGSAGVGGLNPTSSNYSASDGLEDPEVTFTPPGANYVVSDGSWGKHLVQKTAPDGSGPGYVLSLDPISMSTTGTGGGISGSLSLSATVDSRAVSISSNLGQTYKRPTAQPAGGWTQAVPILDQPQPEYEYADTVAPDASSLFIHPTVDISYSASPIGNWSTNSSYLWNFMISGYSTNGTFQPGSIGGVSNTYINAPTGPGTQEAAIIHLTDAGDGAEATYYYYVNFHAPFENWTRTSVLDHPLVLVDANENVNTSGDWSLIMIIDNDSPTPLSLQTTNTTSFSKTLSGTIGGQQSTGPDVAAAFQANESITVGVTSSVSVADQTTFTGHAYTRTRFFGAQTWEERWGTCSVWSINGYQGDTTWYGVYAPNPGQVSIGSHTDTYYPGYTP